MECRVENAHTLQVSINSRITLRGKPNDILA
jgi:hypothetical protein